VFASTRSQLQRVRPVGIGVVLLLALSVLGPAARADTGSHAWAMDEAPGTGTMFDSGSPATDGNWINIQAGVPGTSGTAYRFDGTSRVSVPDAASLDPGTDTFTVSAKVKFSTMPTDANGGDFDLIRKGLGSTSGGYWKIEAYPNSAHTKASGLCQMKGSAGHIKITGAPVSLNNNQWHTLTCAKTGSSVTLTVDGTNYRKTVTIGSIANGDPLTVGADRTGDDAYIGDMDEVSYAIGSSPPPPPPDGIFEAQTAKANASATSISATFGSSPQSGDVLVAAVVVPVSASPSFDTPAGWTAAFTPARGAVFWRVSDGSEKTVTVNLSSGEASRPLRMWVVELGGANTSNPFDQGGSAVVSSATASMTASTTGQTAQADEWAIAVAAQNGDNGGGAAATNGFGIVGSDSRSIAATDVLSAAGTVSTTISWNTARAGSWLIATFRAA
jgi:hypothetical protein